MNESLILPRIHFHYEKATWKKITDGVFLSFRDLDDSLNLVTDNRKVRIIQIVLITMMMMDFNIKQESLLF